MDKRTRGGTQRYVPITHYDNLLHAGPPKNAQKWMGWHSVPLEMNMYHQPCNGAGWSGVWIMAVARHFSYVQNVQISSGAPPASNSMGTRVLSWA